jgi:acyl carrier protein
MTERAGAASKDRVAEIVRALLAQQGRDQTIGGDDDLADRGLSSTDMVSLMLTVEEEFGVKIPERELRPANFRSIASIDALVRSLMPQPPAI